MSDRTERPSSPRPHAYWRSLDELADTPRFRQWLAAEFPHIPPEFVDGPTRRTFLKLMGSSLGLLGLTACRWPRETIVPATKQPANRVPGETVQFATALELGGVATGVLVTSYDGRPIKIEGNDKHPLSRGRSNHWMQATILDLYDPDRSQRPRERGLGSHSGDRYHRTWAEFEAFAQGHFSGLKAAGGAGLAVLCEPSDSPSLTDMRERFRGAFPQARWYEYEPIARENELAGARAAFGRAYRTHLHLDKADVVVSLDSDFLMLHSAAVKYAGDFADRRRARDGKMNRLYVLESSLTVTGSVADQRYAARASDIGAIAGRLLEAVAARLGTSTTPVADENGAALPETTIAACADDLVRHAGRACVVVGPRQPHWVHTIAHRINHLLGAHGHTITFTGVAEFPNIGTLTDLVRDAGAGQVQTLVILGGNPVYDAPADLRFAALLEQVPTSIHLSLYDDETSRVCTWHLPRAHALESWGDARAWDGTRSLVQPLIEPLYEGRTPCELLAVLCADEIRNGYEITRRTFGVLHDDDGSREQLWQEALRAGVVPDSAFPEEVVPECTLRMEVTGERGPGYELVFGPDYSTYDGRWANNAWLQEWPDPLTKLTWDNAALMAPADADRLGIRQSGDLIRISHGGRTLEIPAFILPGHAEGSVTLPLGYGRGPAAGVVADGVGCNAQVLRTSDAPWIATGAQVAALGQHRAPATTQDHHAIRSKVGDREMQARVPVLVREATLTEYQDPHFAEHFRHLVHHPPLESLWQERAQDSGHRWGMAIDLSACSGCGACVLACQAENNIPVVGKDEVAMGREMHWIRVDRYFAEASGDHGGEQASAGATGSRVIGPGLRVVHQPVTCMHCELAPCEQVCPVAATVHDTEGLNTMVYNRCIGTRYCANNCPYKVRRFNWFYNHHGPYHPRSLKAGETVRKDGVNRLPGEYRKQPLTEIEKLLNNPEVTVRSRGVMEKCTFCVQRINKVKIKAKNERRPVRDGEVVPACAQACPAGAIVFGDLNDPNSAVRKLHTQDRAYAVLAELNIKPRTIYLARLRNPYEPPDGPAHGVSST
jgi:molybdopterin-containing oxidoreductase family iron-sulfur binding subunit